MRALAREAGLPPASVQRILNDLSLDDMAEQEDGQWRLTYRIVELGQAHLDRLDVVRIAKPHAERIAGAVGEAVNIIVRSGLNAVCVDKTRSDSEGMQLDWPVGIPGPLHCGGAGKAMLSFSNAATQEAVLSKPLAQLTPHTLTDPVALRRMIELIRARGYSLDEQEVVVGVYCLACPILDSSGNAIAALSISGPKVKRASAEIEPAARQLAESCRQISRQFGYLGPWPGFSD